MVTVEILKQIQQVWDSLLFVFKGILAAPPKANPPRNKRLIRPY